MSPSDHDPTPVPRVESLYRYPVKGLTPENLSTVSVEAGSCVPFDRAYAIENGRGRFDPLQPKHLPKISFFNADA